MGSVRLLNIDAQEVLNRFIEETLYKEFPTGVSSVTRKKLYMREKLMTGGQDLKSGVKKKKLFGDEDERLVKCRSVGYHGKTKLQKLSVFPGRKKSTFDEKYIKDKLAELDYWDDSQTIPDFIPHLRITQYLSQKQKTEKNALIGIMRHKPDEKLFEADHLYATELLNKKKYKIMRELYLRTELNRPRYPKYPDTFKPIWAKIYPEVDIEKYASCVTAQRKVPLDELIEHLKTKNFNYIEAKYLSTKGGGSLLNPLGENIDEENVMNHSEMTLGTFSASLSNITWLKQFPSQMVLDWFAKTYSLKSVDSETEGSRGLVSEEEKFQDGFLANSSNLHLYDDRYCINVTDKFIPPGHICPEFYIPDVNVIDGNVGLDESFRGVEDNNQKCYVATRFFLPKTLTCSTARFLPKNFFTNFSYFPPDLSDCLSINENNYEEKEPIIYIDSRDYDMKKTDVDIIDKYIISKIGKDDSIIDNKIPKQEEFKFRENDKVGVADLDFVRWMDEMLENDKKRKLSHLEEIAKIKHSTVKSEFRSKAEIRQLFSNLLVGEKRSVREKKLYDFIKEVNVGLKCPEREVMELVMNRIGLSIPDPLERRFHGKGKRDTITSWTFKKLMKRSSLLNKNSTIEQSRQADKIIQNILESKKHPFLHFTPKIEKQRRKEVLKGRKEKYNKLLKVDDGNIVNDEINDEYLPTIKVEEKTARSVSSVINKGFDWIRPFPVLSQRIHPHQFKQKPQSFRTYRDPVMRHTQSKQYANMYKFYSDKLMKCDAGEIEDLNILGKTFSVVKTDNLSRPVYERHVYDDKAKNDKKYAKLYERMTMDDLEESVSRAKYLKKADLPTIRQKKIKFELKPDEDLFECDLKKSVRESKRRKEMARKFEPFVEPDTVLIPIDDIKKCYGLYNYCLCCN